MSDSSRVADRGVTEKSHDWEGKPIALGICGGIGAVEVVKIIREIRRHGARVTAFLTPAVETFVSALSLEWASGESVVKELRADVNHLEAYSLVVVVPATLNTIAKCAAGLCDNPVTLLIAGQFGVRRPILFVPAMNEQLTRHPLYAENVNKLKSWGAKFHEPEIEEGRMKVPSPEALVKSMKLIL
jgi:phosphopantothenoylcysteine decarboxylase/phosphopantothenate--cysteine ligase